MKYVTLVASVLPSLASCAPDHITAAEETGDYSVYSGRWSSDWMNISTASGSVDIRYLMDLTVKPDGVASADVRVQTPNENVAARRTWTGNISGSRIQLYDTTFALPSLLPVDQTDLEGRINEQFIRFGGAYFQARLNGDLFLFADR